jgi:hypothetical protein
MLTMLTVPTVGFFGYAHARWFSALCPHHLLARLSPISAGRANDRRNWALGVLVGLRPTS